MKQFQDRCPACGSTDLITTTPAIPGPAGWGQRCGDCAWVDVVELPSDEAIYREAGMTPAQIAEQLEWEAAIERGDNPNEEAQA